MSEARAVTQKCPNCGANLAVAPKSDRFACEYCGATVAVERKGGDVSLSAIHAVVAELTKGSGRSAAELAIKRVTAELDAARAARARRNEAARQELAVFDEQIAALGERQGGFHVWIDTVGIALPALVWAAYDGHAPVIIVVAALVAGWWLARRKRDVAGRIASFFWTWGLLYAALMLSTMPFMDLTKTPPAWLIPTMLSIGFPCAIAWSALRTRRRAAKRQAALAAVEAQKAVVEKRVNEEDRELGQRVREIESRIAEYRARADG